MSLIWHMVMSSAFLMIWYLAVLGTVWTENKKMVVPGNLKCARNNREIQPAGRSTRKEITARSLTDVRSLHNWSSKVGEWRRWRWIGNSFVAVGKYLFTQVWEEAGRCVVALTWAVMEVGVQEISVKTHSQCQVRGKLLIPRYCIRSLSRQYFCCDMFPGTTFTGLVSCCTVGKRHLRSKACWESCHSPPSQCSF